VDVTLPEIMTEQEKNMPLEIAPEAQEIARGIAAYLPHLCMQMSGYQIENGTLSDVEFPTAHSKFWQCVREIWGRYDGLISLQYQANKLRLEVLKYEEETTRLRKAGFDLDAMLAENEANYGKLKLAGLKLQVADTLRVMKIFYEKMKSLEHKPTQEEGEDEFWKEKFVKSVEAVKDVESLLAMLKSGTFNKIFREGRKNVIEGILKPQKVLILPQSPGNGAA